MRHAVASALRTRDGQVFTGLHISGTVATTLRQAAVRSGEPARRKAAGLNETSAAANSSCERNMQAAWQPTRALDRKTGRLRVTK